MSQLHWREKLRRFLPYRTFYFGMPDGPRLTVDEFLLPLSAIGASTPDWTVMWVRSGFAPTPQTVYQQGNLAIKLCHPLVHAPFRQHSPFTLVLARRAVMKSFLFHYNLGGV